MTTSVPKTEGSALPGILAILATLAVLALVVLQVLEYLHYGQSPSVWPS